jgi:hypothetical protein
MKMTLLKSQVRLIQSIWLGYGLWTAVVAGCCGYSAWRNMINVYWGDEIITPSFCLVIQVDLTMMISLAISVSGRVEVGRNDHTWLRCIMGPNLSDRSNVREKIYEVNLHSVQFNTHQEMRSNHNTFSDRKQHHQVWHSSVYRVPWGK